MSWTKGARVEVKGAEAGFNDSWWPATVASEKPGRQLEVTYKTLVAKEGSKANLKELVATKLVRPSAPDDSKTTKLSKRLVGEAVDYWYEGGWWTGYVHRTEDDQISVYFPSFPEEPMAVKVGAPASDDAPRVRTSLDYDEGTGQWTKLPLMIYPGCADFRTLASVKVARSPAAAKKKVGVKGPKPVQKQAGTKRQRAKR